MAEVKIEYKAEVKGLKELKEKVERINIEFIQDATHKKAREITEAMRQKLIATYPGIKVEKQFIGQNIKIGLSNIGQLNRVKIDRLTKEMSMMMEKLQGEKFVKVAKE